MLHCKEVDISSEKIRELAARGKSVIPYVPEKVAEYIRTQGLYQEDES